MTSDEKVTAPRRPTDADRVAQALNELLELIRDADVSVPKAGGILLQGAAELAIAAGVSRWAFLKYAREAYAKRSKERHLRLSRTGRS